MIGLDTNVVVRYILQDDPTQSQQATRITGSCSADDKGFVSIVKLAEITWVLKAAYGAGRAEIGEVIENLLQTQTLVVQMAEVAWKALASYRKGEANAVRFYFDFPNASAVLYSVCLNHTSVDRAISKVIGHVH